jgi:flavin-dependent dehydrogenase
VEKGVPSKDKACGDAWIPDAVEELKSFEIAESEIGPNSRPFSRIEGYYAERKVWSVEYAPFRGIVARRAIVDQLLRNHVTARGSVIWYNTRATELRMLGGQIELTIRQGMNSRTLTPSAVVLASGSGCRIARVAGLDGEPTLGASISSYLRADENIPVPAFLFGDPSPGYAWIFPHVANSLNVGVCALAPSATSALRFKLKALLTRVGVEPAVASRGGLEAIWSGKGTKWHHEAGVISCGDAAGLVDPLCGEGLTAALVSGRYAGQAVASFLAGASCGLVGYSRWVRKWAQVRYAAYRDSRVLAGWVGNAAEERQLLSLIASWI